jgi:OOP family OmpA-OmpF porin
VVAYLVSAGVAPERLVPRGYGEGTPLLTNRTSAGRLGNRRVQFMILEPVPELPPG